MKSSIYKRITSFAVVIVFYTKQAMAGIFLIPPLVYIASVVISAASLGAIYSMDKKPVLKVNSQPNTAWNSSINDSTERGPESMSTVKVVPLPSPQPDPQNPTSQQSICDYKTPALFGPYSQYIGMKAYSEMVDSIIVREVGSTTKNPRDPDIHKWMIDASQKLSVEPGSVFGFYKVNLPYSMNIAQVDSLISKMRLSDTRNWPRGKGCQYASIEPNRKSVPNANGFEYLMSPDDGYTWSADFIGAWQKLNVTTDFLQPQTSSPKAIKEKKIASNPVDIAVLDSGFSSLNDVQKYDGYNVKDLHANNNLSSIIDQFDFKPVDRTQVLTGGENRHGTEVTYVLASSLNLIEPSSRHPFYPLNFINLLPNKNFNIHQYVGLTNYMVAAAIRDIIRKKYKLISSSVSADVDLTSQYIQKLRGAKDQSYDKIHEKISPIGFRVGKELLENEVLLVEASGNDSTEVASGVALSRNVLVVGGTGLRGHKLSISPNPSFVVAREDNIFVKSGEEKAGEMAYGTSFSAPQVTAVAAMMMAINPKLKADAIRSAIVCTAEESGKVQPNPHYDASLDGNGYMKPYSGLLNAPAAIDFAIASLKPLDLTSINLTCQNKNSVKQKNECCVIF